MHHKARGWHLWLGLHREKGEQECQAEERKSSLNSRTSQDRLAILSAKYGLISPKEKFILCLYFPYLV